MSEFVTLALSVGVGYVIGSFPTAYLFVLWKSKIDIRQAGSGNVGALNSYQVTRSRSVGGLVLLLDLAKGMAAVAATSGVLGGGFATAAGGALGAVAGHNFPLWLKGRGGRGLATAAGAMLLLSWVWVVVWGILWGAAFLPLRRVNPASAAACGTGLALVLFAPAEWLGSAFPQDATAAHIRLFGSLLFVLLLSRLVGPLAGPQRVEGPHLSNQE